jgi:hypothetical protein
MIPAIKIILERVKTNPEEFANGGGGWLMLVHNYWHILTPEEKTQLRDGLREVLVPQFNERVVRELMKDSSPYEAWIAPNGQEVVRINGMNTIPVQI